ncbi:MAG TPA: MarR family transcriptional regulator [Burkholderiales bacterium]|nr:MarR family transcriptional regulator [Burkholderiales bacterium]
MSKKLNVRVSGLPDALDRFEAAWHFASGRGPVATVHVLSFADLPTLLKTLTPARWQLLGRLRAAGPSSVHALARRLERDYKNVYMDVKALVALGLIERREGGKIAVGWDAVRAELRF